MALLEVRDLKVYFYLPQGTVRAVNGVSFSLNQGETLAIVGESGSGKSITALSVMRLLPLGAKIIEGEIFYNSQDLLRLKQSAMPKIRGKEIAMIFQDPGGSLNPLMTIGEQITEALKCHRVVASGQISQRVIELLGKVRFPDPENQARSYPHQLSGGMKQRAMIAIALSSQPKILIADEPTTALDVTVQAQVLDLMRSLAKDLNLGVIFITHNLGLVAEYADRTLVMKEGEIVDSGKVDEIFYKSQHPYTRELIEVIPRIDKRKIVLPECEYSRSKTILDLKDLKVHFPIYTGRAFKKKIGSVKAVDGVSFSVFEGETLGIVGETGCGKSTLARTILRLISRTETEIFGEVNFKGIDILGIEMKKMQELRRKIQIVFQESTFTLNPRRSVGDSVEEPFLIHGLFPNPEEREEKVNELFRLVQLDPEIKERFPAEFSAGQRQRICIARALALEPELLILDEPVASLDVSVQAKVIRLLLDLKKKLNLTYILISHDLALVKELSSRIIVMYLGKVAEEAPSDEIVQKPLHSYTQALISATPIPDPKMARARKRIILEGELPSPANPPSGCKFHTRCPLATEECSEIEPELRDRGEGHLVACHKV